MKKKCIDFFNNLVSTNNIDVKNLIELVSEYLTDINYENSDKMINSLVQHPELISMFNILDKITTYFTLKYKINWITFNNKIIVYYG